MTLGLPLTAFAYYGSSYEYERNSYSGVYLFVLVVYITICVIFIARWWMMTIDIKEIRKTVAPPSKDLLFLINIGEKELAEKVALKERVSLLSKIYEQSSVPGNSMYEAPGPKMDEIIQEKRSTYERLNITLPDYVSSGAKFIDHMNALTGRNIAYDQPAEKKDEQAE